MYVCTYGHVTFSIEDNQTAKLCQQNILSYLQGLISLMYLSRAQGQMHQL